MKTSTEVRHRVRGQEPLLSEDIMHWVCEGSGGQERLQGTGAEPLLNKNNEHGGQHQQGEGLEHGVVLDRGVVRSSRRGMGTEPTRSRIPRGVETA